MKTLDQLNWMFFFLLFLQRVQDTPGQRKFDSWELEVFLLIGEVFTSVKVRKKSSDCIEKFNLIIVLTNC